MKNFLLIIALFISLQLIAADNHASEYDRFLPDSLQATGIVDSVYSDSILDGYLKFSQNAQDISVNNWMYDMHVGDTGVGIVSPDPNSHFRSFLSFDLPGIPEGYLVDSVYVRIYQYYILGNSYEEQFPEWNVADGDTINCMLSHIDYGNELDASDWDKGDLDNPFTFNHKVGVVTATPEYGYRYVDVTNCVIADYAAGRNRSQYRIAFENITTDWDGESDLVSFVTSSAHDDYHLMPNLYIASSLDLSNYINDTVKPEIMLTNYPNPFNPSTEIRFQVSDIRNKKPNIEIYNIKGQKIRKFDISFDSTQGGDSQSVVWNGLDNSNNPVSSGVYFAILKEGNRVMGNQKMLLLK